MQTVTSDVTLELPGLGVRTAVRTLPAEQGPWPGVVMLHEAFGINDILRRQAARLAGAGFVVLAPDLLGGSWLRCVRATVRAMTAGEGPPFAVLDAARTRLLADPDGNGRVGVIGFCMGGGFALLAATRGFDVAAVNYGPPPADLDAALVGACPVVASYGGRDKALAGTAARLDAALTRQGVRHDVAEYPKAGHSFLNDAQPLSPVLHPLMKVFGVGPEPVAAADAWSRIEEFFTDELR